MFLDTPAMVVIQFRPSGAVAESMWWVDTSRKIMPLRGPTCKIARFQAELKFPSWAECGNFIKVTNIAYGPSLEQILHTPCMYSTGAKCHYFSWRV